MAKRIKPVFGRFHNVGGHIINPPEECKYRKKWGDEAVWTDLACCFILCEEQCKKYLWFKKATPRMRIRYLKRNGVYYPW